jgi:anaerobic magnesium-protoporphyrin IX monomethyl ester cyclase
MRVQSHQSQKEHHRQQDPDGNGPHESADIVLIYPYFYTHAPQAMLFHPLGIARLAAILRSRGMRVRVIDGTFSRHETIVSEIIRARPRIVGIYAMLSMSENAMAIGRDIRRMLPEILLVSGGPLPTLRPEQFLPAFDAVFRGEADASFPDFCRDYLAAGRLPEDAFSGWNHPEKYPGIYYHHPQSSMPVSSMPEPSGETRLNGLPLPDRSDYDHSSYQKFWLKREGWSLAGIMTSYGCPFDCEFCSKPVFGAYFRQCRMDKIFEEINDIRDRGYQGLWIADDCFSLDPEYTRNFCRRMIAEKMDMKWFCLCRVDRMDPADIDLWQAAGCRKVFLGLESGSNDILKLMNKKTTIQAAEKTIHRFAKSNIRTAGFFMVGYPGETYETIETTFQWALSLPLDEISFTVPYPLPGTRLYERVARMEEAADWQYENENRLVFQSEFDEAYLKKRIDDVYRQFNAARGRADVPDPAGTVKTEIAADH